MEFDPNENKNGFNPNGSGMGPNDDFIDSSFAVQFKPNDPAGSVSDKLKQNSYPSNDYDDGFEDEFKDEFDNFEFDASISAFKPLAAQPESEKPAFSAKPEEKAPETKAEAKPEEPAKPAFAPINKEPEKPAFAPFGKAPEKPEVKDKPAEPVKPAFAPANKAPEKSAGVDDIPEFKPQDLEFNSFGKDKKDEKDLPGNKIFEKGNDLDFATSEQDKATSPFASNKPEAKDAKDEGIKTFGTVSSGVDAFKKADEPKKEAVKPSPFTAPVAPATKAEPSKPSESAFAKPAEKKSPFGKPFSPKPSPSVHFDAGKPADKAPAKAEEKAPVIEDKKEIPAAGIAAGTAAVAAAGFAAAKTAEPKTPVAPAAPAAKETPKAAPVAPAAPVVKDAPKAAPVAPAAPLAKEAPKAAPVAPAAPAAKEAPKAAPVAPAAPASKEAPKAPVVPAAPAKREEPANAKPADQAKKPVSNTGMAAASERAPKEAPAAKEAPKTPAAPAAKEAPRVAAAPINKLNPAESKDADAKLDNANKPDLKRPAPRGTPQAPAIPPRRPVPPAANNTAAQNAFERNERKAASKAVPHDNHKQITAVTPVSKSKRKSKPVKETRSPGIAGVITLVCVMIAFVGVLWVLSNTDKISSLFGGTSLVSLSETKKEKETETEKITTATSEEETEPEETTTEATTESTTEATTEETTKETTEATTEETTKETTEETTKETTEETTTEATTVETTKKPSTSGGSVVTDFNTKLSGFKQTSGGFKFDITLTNKSNETADLKASLEEVDITFYANSDITSITCDEMTFTGSGKDWVGVPNGATIEAGDEYSFTVYVNTESSVTKYGYNSCYFDWN